MGLTPSTWMKEWRQVFEDERRGGLKRRKNFDDFIKDMKMKEGWGSASSSSKKAIDISLNQLNIKDAICEKPFEDDSTDENSESTSEWDLNWINTVQVYPSKDVKRDKNSSLRKTVSFEPKVLPLDLSSNGGIASSKCSKIMNRSSMSNILSSSKNMIAFRNLVDSNERLRNKVDSIRKVTCFNSPMSVMSMRFI